MDFRLNKRAYEGRDGMKIVKVSARQLSRLVREAAGGVEAVSSDGATVVLAVSTTAGLAAIGAVVLLGDLLPGVHIETYVEMGGEFNRLVL
jgi:hypothetical protein